MFLNMSSVFPIINYLCVIKNEDMLVYNFIISIYDFGISIFSLFNVKAKKLRQGRKDTLKLIKTLRITEKTIWVHCASLGEFEQGRPVIEALKKKDLNQKIVLTFFSPSGYEVRKDYEFADYIFYLPSDKKRYVKKFVDAVNPSHVLFVKYEFWYYYLKYLNSKNINVYIISALFRKEHIFFKWYGGRYRKLLFFFTKLFVQDEESAELLRSVGVKDSVVAGDTRFDRVYEIAQQAKDYELLEKFSKGSVVLVGGSTWPSGEKLIAEYLKKNKDIKILLAPHEIHEEHLRQIEDILPVASARYTKLDGVDLAGLRVLIVDTMGMLSSMYRYGDFAYIGGGFGSGIHNTIEASTFGLPVIFGPNYKKYQEACDLIKMQAGFCVTNQQDFDRLVDNLMQNQNFYKQSSQAALKYVDSMRGSTELIIRDICR